MDTSEETIWNCFNYMPFPFPMPQDDKVDSNMFIQAAQCLAELLERFGKLFQPLLYDIYNNLRRISAFKATHETGTSNLTDMIEYATINLDFDVIDSLIWLIREICLVLRFFELLVEDYDNGIKKEDLQPYLRKAFEDTLHRYQTWTFKHLFKLVSMLCPKREELISLLTRKNRNKEEQLFSDMKQYIYSMRLSLEHTHQVLQLSNFGHFRF